MANAATKEPSGTLYTSRAILSGGVYHGMPFRFQSADRARGAPGSGAGAKTVMESDGRTGGVDALAAGIRQQKNTNRKEMIRLMTYWSCA
jgi:hypothetical protein